MKVIAVNGKVLLANGKAVKPPVIPSGSELVLSATRLPAVTICTDVIQNHIVSVATFASSCTVEDTTPPPAPKYSYNGVVLPEIPADVLAQYPYAWIRLNSDGNTYDLILSPYTWYYSNNLLTQNSTYVWYTSTASTTEWTYKTSYTDDGSFNLGSGLVWSNHDIPNGSATATEIYFWGSEPVLVE